MTPIEIGMAPDGSATTTSVDLLEDLWYDFLSSRRQAEIAARRKDILKTNQHQRAALFALVPYLTGVANRWCIRVLETTGAGKGEVTAFISEKSLQENCELLANRVGEASVPAASLACVGRMAADLANLTPPKELELFQALSSPELVGVQDEVLTWYDTLSTKLGLAKHQGARKQGLGFTEALGETTRELYSDFAELRQHPDAWKQELEEREAWE